MTRLALRIAAAAAIAFAVPTPADAGPCQSLTNPVYLQVGDTQLNLMKRLGRALRDNTSNPITLVFITSGSCVNIQALYKRIAIPATTNMQYIPSKDEVADADWSLATPTLTCTPRDGGVVPDIGNSALFNSACTTEAPPASVKLTQGPVQAYVMVVPTASPETAITFEEAYFVFGFGMAGMILPWVDELQMFIRTTTKSTLLAWAANIGVPGGKWKGKQFDGSPEVVNAVKAGTGAAIGILGAEVYDGNRATMKALAYRARGQYAAYYPDSSASSRDKKNVRDGHYTVWSPTIWMDTVEPASGTPVNPHARYVVDLIAGKTVTPTPTFSAIDVIAAVGLVPDCAMEVNRTFEGGPLALYRPSESCTCKYESLVDATSCVSCTTSCATGVCRNGYCERQ
jgi:hypothetical protein